VLIHVAEPSAFFDPWDYHNERWEELKEFRDARGRRRSIPPFETLMAERNRLFARHRERISSRRIWGFMETTWSGWENSRFAAEHVCGHRRSAGGTGAATYSAHDFLVKYQTLYSFSVDVLAYQHTVLIFTRKSCAE